MKKYEISFVERLEFRKSMMVELPENMPEQDLENAMDRIEKRSGTISANDLPYIFESYGIKPTEWHSLDDYSSPDQSEIEIDEYHEE